MKMDSEQLGEQAYIAIMVENYAEYDRLLEIAPANDLFGRRFFSIVGQLLNREDTVRVINLLTRIRDDFDQLEWYTIRYGHSLLEAAASYGYMDVYDALLRLGYPRRPYERPLHFACRFLQVDMVTRLLAEGEDPNELIVPNGDVLTFYTPRSRLEMSQARPLHMVMMNSGNPTNQLAIIDHLLAHGADPLNPAPLGPTDLGLIELPIQVAGAMGCHEAITKLLDLVGLDQLLVGKTENKNCSALQYAIRSQFLDAIRAIMEHPGFDINTMARDIILPHDVRPEVLHYIEERFERG